MDDVRIIELYFARSEDAIRQTALKYGAYLRMIAGGILPGKEDREECVQDTYLRTWETIPPKRPQLLRTYLGCLTRTISISRWRAEHAAKRGGTEFSLSFDELGECIPASDDTAAAVADRVALTEVLDRFLAARRPIDRRIFLQRYWYFRSIKEIARDFAVAEGSVKASLHRSRGILRRMLEEEGIAL